jgi:ATP-dependent DNA helicase RecQ
MRVGSPVTPADPLEPARRHLQRHYGFSDFRPAQRRVVGSVVRGRDVLAVLPTGGGKSICYQIPGLARPGLTLVVSPLISLMQDQVEAARQRGLPAAYVNSALDPEAQAAVLDAVAGGACRLLYVAPERLRRLSADLDRAGVGAALLAVDEAHCITEWGHDFRPAYRVIRPARELLGWPQCIAVTGSATPEVRDDIRTSLGLGTAPPGLVRRRFDLHLGSFDRVNLWFGVLRVKDDRQRLAELFRLLKAEPGTAIVYAGTRNLTEALARVLRNAGIVTLPYHAGLTGTRRAETLERFLAGQVRVVAATCAFGMGIDKPDVRLVVHWTVPATPESYYQEAGRAGRDGERARCILLYAGGDAAFNRLQLDTTFPPERTVERAWADPRVFRTLPSGVRASVERLRGELRPEPGRRPDWSRVRRRRRLAERRIEAMERYAAGRMCRRRALIGWFGEELARCAGCDRCG